MIIDWLISHSILLVQQIHSLPNVMVQIVDFRIEIHNSSQCFFLCKKGSIPGMPPSMMDDFIHTMAECDNWIKPFMRKIREE